MTGPHESVIGREIAPSVARFLDGMPRKFDIAVGDVRLCGARVDIDRATGRAERIETVILKAASPPPT
jgi:calcineurin-like phosphoesterase